MQQRMQHRSDGRADSRGSNKLQSAIAMRTNRNTVWMSKFKNQSENMQQELVLCLGLLERRMALLLRLTASLRDSVQALTNLDASGIHDGARRQDELCREIRSLDVDLRSTFHKVLEVRKSAPHERLATEFVNQLLSLNQRSQDAAEQVSHWNAVQSGLLRRSRRYVNAVMNVFANYSGICDRTSFAVQVQHTVTEGA